MDIQSWLTSIGLQQYLDNFQQNDIDFEVLSELEETDLEKIGISLGHRKKILKYLRQGVPTLESGSETDVREDLGDRAEFRFLTIMFCDLVGSTELTATIGAEQMRQVNRTFQDTCKSVIAKYQGYIARYMGDGILAYFGYPQAQEHDAVSAVYAGLETIRQLVDLDVDGQPLKARIGIATGQVVIDQIGHGESRERSVVGDAPNLAARLQSIAEPNSLVIGPATKNLIESSFTLVDLGSHHLKGIKDETQAWQVEDQTSERCSIR